MSVSTPLNLLVADLSRSSPAINAYHDRAVGPEQTFTTLKRHFSALGITRVGLLTDLDVIGIPVAFAARPNSHTLSVFQGKGVSQEAAMASAAMEAMETRMAEQMPPDVSFTTVDRLQDQGIHCIDLDSVARCVPSEIGCYDLPWTTGYDLVTHRDISVPWWLVGLDHRGKRPPGFEQSSDGLASGNTPAEAVLHGLCELVERDAWALLQLKPLERLQESRIDPRGFGDLVIDIMVDRIERSGMQLLLLDMTSDIEVPAFLAVIMPGQLPARVDARWSQICGGCGCHPDPVRAALRAITEAAQSRLTAIAGSRDDFSPKIYQSLDQNGAMGHLARLFDNEKLPPRAIGKSIDAGSIQATIHHLTDSLIQRGIEQIVAVPIPSIDPAFSVVRMIVPGLEVDMEGEHIQMGLRAVNVMNEARI